MKREVKFIFIFVFLLLSVSLICASEEEQVAKAYECLNDKINNSANCSTFSFEESIFSLLATGGECQSEIISENLSNKCWPKSGCKIKSTAQAVLALNEDINTTLAENWLLSQTTTPTDINWFLEIESAGEATSCSITYLDSSYTILISKDKKISSKAGSALTLAQDGYWLEISPSLYNKNIYISCNKSFMTTLLFKKKDSSTIQVSETVHSAAANGITTEIVDSLCFSQNGACTYEGSLWSTFVLYSLDYDVSKFVPYLVTMREEESSKMYLPEAFLYFITGKFNIDLLNKQKVGLYWEESGDKYYDTALALWPLHYEDSYEKTNSISWLLDVQQSTGCWNNGNTLDTAFILYSIWPTSSPNYYEECSDKSDCPSISCKSASCDGDRCIYSYLDCEDDDGCCNPGCSALTDNDCTEEEPSCDSNSDCDDYASETDEYCDLNRTRVYQNVSTWKCENSLCVESVDTDLLEKCDSGEKCYAGNCLATEDIPEDECEYDSDCSDDEACSDGYCISNVPDCEDEGYFCMSQINCEGEIFTNYDCASGVYACCSEDISLLKCSDEGGNICGADEVCTDGTIVDVSDTVYGETCCVWGECETETTPTTTTCEKHDGVCRSSCNSDEEESSAYECNSGESCCMEKKKSSSKALIWILLALILVAGLAVVFREKLRLLWLKLKNKFGKKKERKNFSMPMPISMHANAPGRGVFSRGILPHPSSASQPVRRPQMNRPPVSSQRPLIHKRPSEAEKPKDELDDVLKKLKEMGK